MPDQVPTKVSALPELAEETVNATAQTGEIQTFKSQGRLIRTELDQWLDEQQCGGAGGDRGE
jgi:hypothetical protein